MKLRGAIALALLAVPVVAWTAIGSAGAQAPGCLPTSDRTVGPHGFSGLGIKGRAPVYTDALQFVLAQFKGISPGPAQHDADALNSEGFVSGIGQRFFGKKRKTKGDMAISVAYQLGSPQQAQAQLDRDLATFVREQGPWKRFTVPAIPGSQGLRDKKLQSVDGAASNVLFTDGDYSYVVGMFVNRRDRRGGTGADHVTKAAINLYNRVHGAAVCP
jgi:hypothetical protein